MWNYQIKEDAFELSNKIAHGGRNELTKKQRFIRRRGWPQTKEGTSTKY